MTPRQSSSQEPGTSPVQLGIVPYANAWPLTRFLPDLLPGCRMTPYLPSQLQFRLISHHIDVALMPIAALMELPTGMILGNACIGCRGPVESVLIVSKKPLSKIRTIAMDISSRSSVLLAEVLFHEFYGIKPKKYRLPVETDPLALPTDAFLIIGNPALQLETCDPWNYRYDLGELWEQKTSLPFVFAAWIACRHKQRDDRSTAAAISEARNRGMAAVPQIIEEQIDALPVSPERMRHYLTRSIRYVLGSDERIAIDAFIELAMLHRLIPARNRILYLDDDN